MSNDPTTKLALDLITGAMRKTGQYAPGEAIAAADLNDALDSLNGLLDVLSNDNKAIFNSVENIVTLTAGQQSYTVGLTGQIPVQRPLRITDAYSRVTTSSSTVDFPCEIKDLAAYASVGLKSQPGPWAKFAFYNPTFPNGQLYFWPVPSQAVEFHFWSDALLQSVSLTTALTLPQGYYLFLQLALTELLCIEYGVPVSEDVKRLMRRYEAAIKSNNAVVDREISVDGAICATNANNASFILTGGF